MAVMSLRSLWYACSMFKQDNLRIFVRLAGICLFLIPLLPLTRFFGPMPGSLGAFGPFDWMLGTMIVLGFAALLAFFLPEKFWELFTFQSGANDTLAAIVFMLLFALLYFVSGQAFNFRPHLIDDIAQLFQAKIFALDLVKAPTPPLSGFFMIQNVLMEPDGWFSQYPPGHALLLSAGLRMKLVWLVPLLLSLGSASCIYRLTDLLYGQRCARVSLLLLLLCPFFFFMGAGFMNHVSELFFLALAFLAFARWEKQARWHWIFLTGLALGVLLLVRPLSSLLAGSLILLFVWPRCLNKVHLPACAGGLLAFLCCAGFYCLYNFATTGDFFLPGYVKLWGTGHGLGFHVSPWGQSHTPLLGLRNELADISLLSEYLFEWPIPGLWPLALFLVSGGKLSQWDRRLLLSALAFPVAYFFYWHRDAFLGPRYLYPVLVFLIPLTAAAICGLYESLAEFSFRVPGGSKTIRAQNLLLALLLVCFSYALVWGVPLRFGIYRQSLSAMKLDLAAEAKSAGIEEGLVFVSVSWGSRIVANLREAGAPASLVEEAYRRVDHCELHKLSLEALRSHDSAALIAAINMKLGQPVNLVRVNVAGADNVRLRPDVPLDAECKREIEYDQSGYGIFAPHLNINSPRLDSKLIFAQDLHERDSELMALFPGRQVWLYRNAQFIRLTK